MTPFRRIASLIAALSAFAARADACKPEARKRLPAAEDLATLCPKDPIFAKAPDEKGDPRGGCTLYFREGPSRFVQVAAARQEPRIAGGPKAGAGKAAETFGRMQGGKAPAVKRTPWKSVEAYALENMPGYFVDSGGDVLVVHVTPVVVKPPSDACTEAIVRTVAKGFAAR